MANWDRVSETLRLDEVLTALGIEVRYIRNGNHWGNCILHDDRDCHFSADEDRLVWNCFVCAEGGVIPKLVIRALGLEDDQFESAWQKAVDWLAHFSEAELVDDGDYEEHAKRLSRAWAKVDEAENRKIPTRANMPVFSLRVLDKLEPVSMDIVAKWGIQNPKTLEDFLIGYDPERMRSGSRGYYTGPAIVIPHFFKGKLVGYQERWLEPEEDRPKWIPKYTNSDDFPKKETLFNYDRAVSVGSGVVVVESVMSVVRLHELGHSAVATFGASVNPQQLRLLRAFSKGVAVSYDNDLTGQKAYLKLIAGLEDVPVIGLPPVAGEKSDIADLSDEEIEDLLWAVF